MVVASRCGLKYIHSLTVSLRAPPLIPHSLPPPRVCLSSSLSSSSSSLPLLTKSPITGPSHIAVPPGHSDIDTVYVMYASICPIGAPSRDPAVKRNPSQKAVPKCPTPPPSSRSVRRNGMFLTGPPAPPPPSSRSERRKGMIFTNPPPPPPASSRSERRNGMILTTNELPPQLKSLLAADCPPAPPSPPPRPSRRQGMILDPKDLPQDLKELKFVGGNATEPA
ncbi:hypothetical protein PGTUg99_014627 [Puccinia graminis f. sp. tritici]|uniref:Uncharacterized protein n=1 Tax=Puccinia graminis f. sp. tritici TaxID=56615 RepID=A0A5B0SI52_PUCGR|nr:hypothetical protein PGTUg99_014627 [Puccinia graminis f. sp. tritici]